MYYIEISPLNKTAWRKPEYVPVCEGQRFNRFEKAEAIKIARAIKNKLPVKVRLVGEIIIQV